MQTIEDIVYAALSHGVKDELYKEVSKIKDKPGAPSELTEVYQKAYDNVVKNKKK